MLENQDSDDKPIIIFDELTTLIKNTIDLEKSAETHMIVGRLNSFLGQLRHWRTDDVGIRMAIRSTVSFDWLNREYGIRSDSINDCVPVNIEELDRESARKLINMCVESQSMPNWSEKFTEELLDFLPAYYPGVIQLAFSEIITESDFVASLNEDLRRKIFSALWKQYFRQFGSRFERYGNSERTRINKLFDALESQKGGVLYTKDVLNILNGVKLEENDLDGRTIIDHLVSDSFIEVVPGGICFSSRLVPSWRNNQL